MDNRGFSLCSTLGAIVLLAGCAGAPSVPSDSMTKPVDLDGYTPKVDTFVVLLDSSDSMNDGDAEPGKFQTAVNSVASFNQAVPDIGIESGLILFGKAQGNCTGHAMANRIYGMTSYSTSGFNDALNAIDCSGGSTPIGDAMDLTASGLPDTAGNVAVFVFSDFMWDEADAVRSAVATMQEQHGEKLCVHTIQVGDYRGSDALISDITSINGCGSANSASDLASADAMTAFAADTLMTAMQPQVMEYEQTVLSTTTLFRLNSATLSQDGQAELRRLAAYINEQGSSVGDIDVIGHTCDLGSERYNQALSVRRAQAVATFLAQEGVSADLMDVSGMGESSPIVSNTNEASRAQNRRVEVNIGTVKR